MEIRTSRGARLTDRIARSGQMAEDQLQLMWHFGFERYVVGHDRGGRTGHRMALDHPDTVLTLTVMDIGQWPHPQTHAPSFRDDDLPLNFHPVGA